MFSELSSLINLRIRFFLRFVMYIVNLIPAEGWPMPFAAPNAMVPVRLELRGSYNNNQTRFHAVGDYVNFLPTPPTNLDNVQVGIHRIRMYRYSFTWVNYRSDAI